MDSKLERKSVSWDTRIPESSQPPGKIVDVSEFSKIQSKGDDSFKVDGYQSSHRKKVITPTPTPKPSRKTRKYSSSSKSFGSRVAKTKSSSWFKKNFPLCCGGGDSRESSDSSENGDIASQIRHSGGTAIDEDEIIARLQQAVNEFGHRPTSYEIESEIIRWHKMLEIEQRLYEESGRPTFKYKHFRKNRYLTVRKHPLYGTNYDNHRKMETRLKEFRFGTGSTNPKRFDYENEQKNATSGPSYLSRSYYEEDIAESAVGFWRNDNDTFIANIALLCSSSNFFLLARACYRNGGFIFLLLYLTMTALVGQPLLYFEMVLGQYSLNGPVGFSKLHPYAKGIPYAIAFVCIVFGTSKSIYLAYSLLYSALSIIASPAYCGWWRIKKASTVKQCLPYSDLEKPLSFSHSTNKSFSTELFFREVVQDSDWETYGYYSVLHWKLVAAYIIVCLLAYSPIYYNFTGRTIKRYLRYTLILPIMVLMLLLHQVFRRGEFFDAVQYFVKVDTTHVSGLSLWSASFEMVLSTLGIGYGFHWAISGRTKFNYSETYKISWHICGYSILIGLVSSLVVFCEVALVGKATNSDDNSSSPFHVFPDNRPEGISFVAFSGALIKFGNTGTTLFVIIFFLLFTIYGMWSQVIITDVILQWFENGYIIKGKSPYLVKPKRSSTLFAIGIQLTIMSPYLFSQGASVLASENIFIGPLAAYIVVLAELVVIVYLYGFTQFSADLEIMSKRPVPNLFQVQIRYIVIPTILIFMLPVIFNFRSDSILYTETDLGWIRYIGVVANFVPIFIIAFFTQWKLFYFRTIRKIRPEPFRYTRRPVLLDEVQERRPIFESRFMAKTSCPSQTNSYPIRSEIYQVAEYNMKYVYEAQCVVHEQFQKLLSFKRIQNKWLHAFLEIVSECKIRTMKGLIRYIMLYQKYNCNKVDLRFLRKTMDQTVTLNYYGAIRKLQRMPMNELLPFLADEVIMLTTFHTAEYHYHYGAELDSTSSSSTSSGSSGEDDNNNDSDDRKPTSTISSSTSVAQEKKPKIGDREMHRIIYGRIEKSPQELRTLLTIRLKKGLNLPYEGELSVLKFLRRDRAKKERENSGWSMNDSLPIDHFIPASISKGKEGEKEKVCRTIFHAVVVEGSHHFALQKLPVPRPPIVRVTKAFVAAQAGTNLVEKFGHIVKRRMYQNVEEIVKKRNLTQWPKYRVRRLLWKVSDRLDDDVYDFLDRLLTCIVIIVNPNEEMVKKPLKKMFLIARTRRKIPEKQILKVLDEQKSSFEITTYTEQAIKAKSTKALLKLIRAPSDIVYHSQSSSSDGEQSSFRRSNDQEILDVVSSSGSSSSLSPTEMESAENSARSSLNEELLIATGFYTGTTVTTKSKYVLANETLQHRHLREIQKERRSERGSLDSEDIKTGRIKHISARRWKLLRKQAEYYPESKYTDKEVKLHKVIDIEAERRALLTLPKSKSMENVKVSQQDYEPRKRTISFQNLRYFLESEVELDGTQKSADDRTSQNVGTIYDGTTEFLGNVDPRLTYISVGKTLIVDLGYGITLRDHVPHPRRRSDYDNNTVTPIRTPYPSHYTLF